MQVTLLGAIEEFVGVGGALSDYDMLAAPSIFDLANPRVETSIVLLMGIWLQSVALADGEEVRYQSLANCFKGRRLIGGRVTVTDRRLIFLPNRLDAVTGGQRCTIAIEDIREVRTLEAGGQAVSQRGFGAALRRQIQVDAGSETSLIVTVRDPDRLTEVLHR